MPYTPDEFRAQHLFGCRLDPDHAGACLLDRPFRIRESGGREYLDEHEVGVDEVPRSPFPGPDTRQGAEDYVRAAPGDHADDFDVPGIVDELHEHAGRSWDVSRVPADRFWSTVQAHDVAGREGSAPRDGDAARRDLQTTNVGSSAPGDGDAPDGRCQISDTSQDAPPLLDSTDAAVEEVRWIAREARALREVDDPERRARLVERKRALLAYIEATTRARS